MSEKLKPCPFCGGEAIIETFPDPSEKTKWNEPYYVACKGCGTYKNDFATEELAMADWNRRSADAELLEAVIAGQETLQKALAEEKTKNQRLLEGRDYSKELLDKQLERNRGMQNKIHELRAEVRMLEEINRQMSSLAGDTP
ncbi:MAG: Lar family restriction alleviation protein [Eubacteriales bacterium]|nr:Lar family restriction alleviation protein [Eubacteriales bacterium]